MDESVLTESGPGTPLYLEYFERLRRLDRRGAIALVEGFLNQVKDVELLYSDVFRPAMIHTGLEWEKDRISVAHEHYISEVTRDLIHQYGRRARRTWGGDGGPGTGGPEAVAICCCVPGERHALGLLMVADVLRASGFEVQMLGEGAPSGAIVAFVKEARATLLCLSCALVEHLPDIPEVIGRIRQDAPGVMVLLGGAAFDGRADEALALGADHYAADLAGLRRLIPKLSGERRPR